MISTNSRSTLRGRAPGLTLLDRRAPTARPRRPASAPLIRRLGCTRGGSARTHRALSRRSTCAGPASTTSPTPWAWKTVTVPLAPRTARAVDLAIGERLDGPIFVDRMGRRLRRDGAARVVRRLAKRGGILKRIGPHSLRHSFITAALDAGGPLRDVQEAASHADPRTAMRYDRARQSLDRHATYIVATLVAGASRGDFGSPTHR